jgi:hypothetical protein
LTGIDVQVIAPTRRWSDGTQTETSYRTKACIEVSSALASRILDWTAGPYLSA